MKRWILALASAAMVVPALGATSTAAPRGGEDQLDLYTMRVEADQVAGLQQAGVDVVKARNVGSDVEIDAVLTPDERDRLRSRGVDVRVKRNRDGKSQRQLAAEMAVAGFTVWRSYDEPGGIRDQLYELANDNPSLVKLEVLGHTYQGREIIAVKVTQGAQKQRDGSRPAVLYTATQHAREWIAVEVNRRLLYHFVDGWRDNDKEIRKLLKKTELWFILVANPDGYQYTFDVERLWRKNLRDNDGDGVITNQDGVDPNRNFDEHWNYDNEGSSSMPSSETYRGPSPMSEPETQALAGLLDRIKPKFQSNWHSNGEWILYPQGWQVGTPEADNPIYVALAGTDADPAIAGFDPGISSDELYVTNGETTDYADTVNGTIAFTPELGEGIPGSEFVFPDDEALVEAEFQRTLPFSLALAKSAAKPHNPVSPVGITAEPFYLDQASIDPENGPLSMFDFKFDVSYGDPQTVRVLAQRKLGQVTVKWRINGGRPQSAKTSEWTGGEVYGVGNSTYYRVMSGEVTGTDPGDTVEVWFEGGGKTSDSFEYEVASDTGNRVLILAAEDYTGASPVVPPGGPRPQFLSYYADALAANGVPFDVYDVDANGRTAPDALGVLSHYDAVIWYTGNDVITREPGWGPGTASSLALTELYEVRDFLNEGGRLLYTGKYAGHQYTGAHGVQEYDPFENAQCLEAIDDRCRALGGAGNGVNDVLEYWFGSAILNDTAGDDEESGSLFDVLGSDTPLEGLEWGFNGVDSAQNQDHSASFIPTSALLDPATYPQFESWGAAVWDRPGGPFAPHTGDFYVYSQIADISYKRLTKTIDVPAGGANLSFWTSYDTELGWDYVAVEARTVGQENWTTLPDLNGHTTQDTGDSCPAGWRELHPHLDHYQTLNDDETCSPTGDAGGEWNAATGNSAGWQQWQVDLADYAGSQVEVSIAYISDWATQGLGVFVDDIVVSNGDGSTSFETGLDGWTVSGSPAGSGPNANDFVRITGEGFPEAAVVATDDTIYMGFGFEGISDAATRDALMGKVVDYLLR